MTYKTRKRLALFVLVFGLPIYITLCVNIVDLFDRPSLWLELAVYVGMGILWAFPLKKIFKGIGQADPDA